MLDAGLPLVQCLEILGAQEDNRHFKRDHPAGRIDVESGASLADAMRKHPKAFDDLYVTMIAAGEAGGILDIILQRLSTYIEKSVKLQRPGAVGDDLPGGGHLIAVLVVWVILWKVIPVFAQLFAGFGAELPFLTRIVIAASNFVGRYSIFIIAGLSSAAMALNRWHKTYRGRRVIDGLHAAACRSSACSCARSRWRASAARSRP